MPVAKHSHPVFTWKRWASLRDRRDVVNMQGAPAASCQVREGAFSVVGEDARAVLPPRRVVVQRVRHSQSLCITLHSPVDIQPCVSASFTKFFHQVSHSVWALFAHIGD
jgi:hypothetical protein